MGTHAAARGSSLTGLTEEECAALYELHIKKLTALLSAALKTSLTSDNVKSMIEQDFDKVSKSAHAAHRRVPSDKYRTHIPSEGETAHD